MANGEVCIKIETMRSFDQDVVVLANSKMTMKSALQKQHPQYQLVDPLVSVPDDKQLSETIAKRSVQATKQHRKTANFRPTKAEKLQKMQQPKQLQPEEQQFDEQYIVEDKQNILMEFDPLYKYQMGA